MSPLLVVVGVSAACGIAGALIFRSTTPRTFFAVTGTPVVALLVWFFNSHYWAPRPHSDSPAAGFAIMMIVVLGGGTAALCWALTQVVRDRLRRK